MTTKDFKKSAKKHRGTLMTAKEFRYCFGMGMKELNELVADGTLIVTKKTNYNKDNVYKVV